MKALHVRCLYLWPRFQAQARQDLEARPPQVGWGEQMSVALSCWGQASQRGCASTWCIPWPSHPLLPAPNLACSWWS